jgi:hypothetical protein
MAVAINKKKKIGSNAPMGVSQFPMPARLPAIRLETRLTIKGPRPRGGAHGTLFSAVQARLV